MQGCAARTTEDQALCRAHISADWMEKSSRHRARSTRMCSAPGASVYAGTTQPRSRIRSAMSNLVHQQ